jgi:hypothetical protein
MKIVLRANGDLRRSGWKIDERPRGKGYSPSPTIAPPNSFVTTLTLIETN